MAQIQLIALDLDGTLLNDQKQIPQVAIHAVDACRARSIHIVLASARPPRGMRHFHQQLRLQTPSINYNGAWIGMPQTGEILIHTPMDPATVAAVITHARAAVPDCIVSLERNDQWLTDRVDPALAVETAKLFDPDAIAPLDTFWDQPITKLMLLAPAEQLPVIEHAIRRPFADQIAITQSDAHLLQIMHPTVNKGWALQKVADDLQIPMAQVMAIGDAPNDLEMLQSAGIGIAVANAGDRLKQIADHVVADNNHAGVSEAIERFVLS